MTRWLVKHGVQEQFLDKANIRDPSFIGHLFTMLLGLSPTMTMPELLRQDPALAEKWFDARVAELGRLPKVKPCCKASGDYDFGKGSVYTLVWGEDGALASVSHIDGTSVEVPKHLAVTREWKLVQWYSDGGATLQLPPVSHSLIKLFPGASGPQALKMTAPQFRSKVLDFERRLKEQGDAGCTTHDDDLLAESRKRQRDELVARARATP